MPRRCKYCFAVLGLCLVSCRAQSDAHDHSSHDDSSHTAEVHSGSGTDFVTYLAAESPSAHVQHMYNESGSSENIFSWMMDSSRGAACAPAAEMDVHDEGPGGDPHAGHDHRRLLQTHHAYSEHAQGADEPVNDEHAHDEDGHEDGGEHDEAPLAAARVLAAESLQEISESSGSDSVKEALAYITACLIDPSCVLERSASARAADAEETHDDHDDHDDHSGHGHGSEGAGKHAGLKVGLACAFFVLTVVASYLPLVFMWSKHYTGILSCLNAFSGSTFLSVGILHLLPHVADYESMANLSTDFPVGLSFVIIGFLLILFIEQVLFDVHGEEEEEERPAAASAAGSAASGSDLDRPEEARGLREQAVAIVRKYHSPLLLEAAVVVHAVLEAMVLGLTASNDTLWLLFWAIASHKGFTAMSQSARFLRLGCPPGLLFVLLAPFHILPPLGVILGSITGKEDIMAGLITSGLATGTFLYIGAFEVIAEEFVHCAHPKPAVMAEKPAEKKEGDAEPCCSGCVDEAERGAGAKEDAEAPWFPSRAVKFAVFVVGCGVMFAITAGLPPHDELHAH